MSNYFTGTLSSIYTQKVTSNDLTTPPNASLSCRPRDILMSIFQCWHLFHEAFLVWRGGAISLLALKRHIAYTIQLVATAQALMTLMCCLWMRIWCMCVDRLFNWFTKCFYTVLKRQCNADIARVMSEFAHSRNRRSMEYMNCTVG